MIGSNEEGNYFHVIGGFTSGKHCDFAYKLKKNKIMASRGK